jgi:hypothetical protein
MKVSPLRLFYTLTAFLIAVTTVQYHGQLTAEAQTQNTCATCSKEIIEAKLPNCTPTPACVPVTLSISTSTVNLTTSIDAAGNYSISQNGIVTINNSAGSTINLSGGSEVSLAGSQVNFAATGVSSTTVNAGYNPNVAPCASEPICAKPCNFGGCNNCNCSLYKSGGGHIYGVTDVYRSSVSFSKQYTVTATNACSTATANFTVGLSGNKTYQIYREFWAQSPISLNLTGQKLNLNNFKLTKVDFKLSKDSIGKVFWFASQETPLLVWDPESKGKIEDGKQLFGSWTFGKVWENGYEALAELDKNKDSVLNGEELKGIRLWKDIDQNGISEKGEVVDLQNYGIKQISVKISREHFIPVHSIKFYISDKGFDYEINGSPATAESFDWLVPAGDAQIAFDLELKRLTEQGYQVYEWAEENYENMDNRSYGYLVVKREDGDKLSGFHIKTLRSDNSKKVEYSLYSKDITGTWSDSRFDFVFQDDVAPGLLSETIKAFASVQQGQIVPEKLEIIHKQGPNSEMKREVKWKLSKPQKPF